MEAQDSSDAVPAPNRRLTFDKSNIVFGHRACQTGDVKWLCIKDAYQKFYRPNFYDIGGTYIQDIPDYWFTCKTEQVGDIFLLHIFVYKRSEGVFNLKISFGHELKIDKKIDSVILSKPYKEIEFKNIRDPKPPNVPNPNPNAEEDLDVGCLEYVTTYSFVTLDIDFMRERLLYIAASFPVRGSVNQNIINNIRINHDCSALMKHPVCSDFTVESADGEIFKVHKSILSVQSEVFKAMFKEETAESQNSFVKLVDLNAEDLKYVVEYLYTGSLKNLENADFVNLLMIADRFNIRGLRVLSQNALAEQLNVSNALYTLVVADMYDSEFLKYAALKFIKRNNDSLQINTFKEITNANLMRELCTYLAD